MRAYGPSGHFTLTRPLAQKYLFVSAGSGVTPMMSMLRWLADCAPMTDVTFLNASRRPEEIVFRAELELLATRMPNLKLGFIPEAASTALPGQGSPAASTVRSCSFSRPTSLPAKPSAAAPIRS